MKLACCPPPNPYPTLVGLTGVSCTFWPKLTPSHRYRILVVSLADIRQMGFLDVHVSVLPVVTKEGRLRIDIKQEYSIQSLLDFLQDYKDCEDKKSISPDWPTHSACPAELPSSSIPPAPPPATQIDSSGPPGQWSQKDNKQNNILEKSGFQGQHSEWTTMLQPWHCISGFTGSKKKWMLYDEFAEKVEKSRCQKLIETPIQQQKGPTPELDAPALETKMQNAEEALKRHEKEAQVKAEEAKADAVRAKEGQVQAKIFANAMENGQRAKVMPTEDDALRASYKAAIVQNEATKDGAKEAKNLRDGKECKQQ